MNPHWNKITRRTLLKGVGVTMALPWLESLPFWGGERPPARRRPRSETLRGPVHGQRHQPQQLVPQAARAPTWN